MPSQIELVEAGVVDAGVVDAGVVDAGVVNAGVVDAGVVCSHGHNGVVVVIGHGHNVGHSVLTIHLPPTLSSM